MRLVLSNNKYQQIRKNLGKPKCLKGIKSNKPMVKLGQQETKYILEKYGVDSHLMHRGWISHIFDSLNQSILYTQLSFSSLLLIKTLFLGSLLVAPVIAFATFMTCLTISVLVAWNKTSTKHEADIYRFNLLLFKAIENHETEANLSAQWAHVVASSSFEAGQQKPPLGLIHDFGVYRKEWHYSQFSWKPSIKYKPSLAELAKSLGKGMSAALTNLGLFVSISHLCTCIPAFALGLSVINPWILPAVCIAVSVIGVYTFVTSYRSSGVKEMRRDKSKQLSRQTQLIENKLKEVFDLKSRYQKFKARQNKLIETRVNYKPVFHEWKTSVELNDKKNDAYDQYKFIKKAG